MGIMLEEVFEKKSFNTSEATHLLSLRKGCCMKYFTDLRTTRFINELIFW